MEFTLRTTIRARAEEIYSAWLSSIGHSKMTGGEANVSSEVGGKFSAWDGYIEGTNLHLQPPQRIVQSWRTSQFEEHEEDSTVEIQLNEKDGITEIILIHTNLPEHGGHYQEGWVNHYFEPMQAYFLSNSMSAHPFNDSMENPSQVD